MIRPNPDPRDMAQSLMATHASAGPRLEYPNRLANPLPDRTVWPRVGWLLVGLLLLAVLPRALMSTKLQSVCPDGVLYIRLAQALDQGDLHAALREMRVNVYPAILLVLHRTGLEWETAGKLWGITMASLVVLPLFGWVRRMCDDRVAMVACLLYIFHGKLIAWSPELIRDQTFWLLLALSVYLMWRAVTEVRLWLFCAAGLTVALSVTTRVEGLFLGFPLVLWSLWRWRWLREGRGRLVLGLAAALLALPVLLLLVNVTFLHGLRHFEITRSEPLKLARWWLQATFAGERVDESVRMSLSQMSWEFLRAGASGLTPAFGLLMLGGMWPARRMWARDDQQALCATSMAIVAGIWIHLWYAQGSSNRYFLPVAILGMTYAALGLLALGRVLTRLAASCGVRAGWEKRIAFGLLVILAVTGSAEALSANYTFRKEEPGLGRWIRHEVGPTPNLLGTEGMTTVLGYYAQGQEHVFSLAADDNAILAAAASLRPDMVLLVVTNRLHRLRPDRYAGLVQRLQGLGFTPVDAARMPAGQDRLVIVKRHQGTAAGNVPATAATDGNKTLR